MAKNKNMRGFTLIEIVIAFAFVALITIAVMRTISTSINLLTSAEYDSIAAQAVIAPDIPRGELKAQVIEKSSREIEAGPIIIIEQEIEIIPENSKTSIIRRIYK